MFIDLLLLMEWHCKLGNRCKFIGVIETTLAPFKVLDPDIIYEQGVPEDLTKLIVGVPMKLWNDTLETECNHFGAEAASLKGLDKGTPNVIV